MDKTAEDKTRTPLKKWLSRRCLTPKLRFETERCLTSTNSRHRTLVENTSPTANSVRRGKQFGGMASMVRCKMSSYLFKVTKDKIKITLKRFLSSQIPCEVNKRTFGKFSTLLLLLLFPALLFAQVPTNGLVAYYPFNGNANDESGNGNNGTVNGATITTDRFGNDGKAYSFNGTNNSVVVPHNSIFNMGNNFSISIWFKVSDVVMYRELIAKASSDLASDLYFDLIVNISTMADSAGLLYARIGGGISKNCLEIESLDRVDDNNWHNAIFTVSDNLILWVDGKKNASHLRTISATQNTSPIQIGYWESNTPMKGKLDDIRIYNRALSETEIASLYHEGGWPTIRAVQQVPADSLLASDALQNSDTTKWTYQASPFRLDTVTITGVVVIPPKVNTYTALGYNMLFADTANNSDPNWRGIFVRILYSTIADTTNFQNLLSLKSGDLVKMTGRVDEYPVNSINSSTQLGLIAGTIQVLGTAPVPPPAQKTPGDFYQGRFPSGQVKYSTGEPLEGSIVELSNLRVDSIQNPTYSAVMLVDASGNSILTYDVSKWFTFRAHKDPTSTWRLPEVGSFINHVRGWIISASIYGYQIGPQLLGDFDLPPLKPIAAAPADGTGSISTNATFKWNTSTGATSYILQVATDTSFTTLAVNSSGITDTIKIVSGLTASTTYYWRVRATSTAGMSAYSQRRSFTTVGIANTPPTAPQNLAITNSSNQSITIKWRKNSEVDFMRYRVYRSTSPSPTTKIDSTAGGNLSDTSRTYTGLVNGTRYYFRVTAVDSAGLESDFSNEVSATPNPPLPPTITSFTPTSGPIGTTVTITGTNFNTTATNNMVYFGAVKATVLSAVSTQLSVTVPVSATYQPITVTDITTGLMAYSSKPFVVTFPSSRVIDANSFAAKVDFATSDNPDDIAICDLDGDGKPDLAVTNEGSNTVSVFRNTSASGSITSSSFATRMDFTTGTNPHSIAIDDLDGDGKPDLAVLNYNSNTVSLFRNKSVSGSITSSSFATKVDFTTGTNPCCVAIGDLDGDGKPDLVVTNWTSNTVSVFRNTSVSGSITSSSFAARVDFATGGNPGDAATGAVVIGDLDGDGKPDLTVTNSSSNIISVFRNTSAIGNITSNSFAARVDFTTSGSPTSVAIGDLDGDGKTDLAVRNYQSNTVSVFRNISVSGSITSNSFAARVDFATGGNPYVIAICDLDGDGKLDLAVTNEGSNTVSVFRNTSVSGSITSSSFATRMDFTTGTNPHSIAIDDLDGDGKPDLAVTNSGGNTVSVLRNTVTTPANTRPSAPQNLTPDPGDGQVTLTWNKNTEADFLRYRIYGGTSSNPTTKIDSTTGGITDTTKTITGLTNGTKYYFRVTAVNNAGLESGYSNEVSATPNPPLPPAITSFSPTSGPIGTTVTITGTNFSTATANNVVYFGACRADVASASTTSLTVTLPVGATYQPITVTVNGLTAYSRLPFIVTFAGGGVITSSSFSTKVDFTTGGSPSSIAIVDLNGDGKPDLAVANEDSNTVSVFRNIGTIGSVFFAAKLDFTTGTNPRSVAISDVDGDGKVDLAIANANSNMVSVFRNTTTIGNVSFAAKADFTTGDNPSSVTIGDVDGDGKPDLAVTNYYGNSVSVFRNTGTIGSVSFATKVDFTTVSDPSSVAIVDLDGDGKPDLAVANRWSNTVSVFRNTGISGTISFAERADFTAESNPYSVAIGDVDGDGKPDLAVANEDSNTVSVFRNTSISGTISFAERVDFTTGPNPRNIAIGDVDGNGKPDLAVMNYYGNTVSIFRNTGTIGSVSFAAKVDFPTGIYPQGVAIGDVDGDGKPDLAVANGDDNTVSIFRNAAVTPPPSAPTNLTATAGNGQVTLRWSKNTEPDFLKYRIYMGSDSMTLSLKDSSTASISDTVKVITGLTNETKYYFRVSALNNARLESAQSYAASATPNAGDVTAPNAPISASISPSGWSNNVTSIISWTNPSDPSGISKVWYRLNAAPDANNPGDPISISSPSFQLNWSVSGIYIIYFYLEDGAGNKNYNNCVSVTAKFDNMPPSINVDSLNVPTYNTNSPVSIPVSALAQDNLSGMIAMTLQYRKAGSTWSTAGSVQYSVFNGSTVSIPQSFIQSNYHYGIDYRVIASDSANNISISTTYSLTIRVNNDVTRTNAAGTSVSQVSASDLPADTPLEYAYRMFSVPLALDNQTPREIFETKTGLSSYDRKVWRFYRIYASGQGEEYPDFADQQAIKPGSGFFFILRNPVVVKTGPGSIVKADSISITGIPLSAGYNAIGNPFYFDYPIDSLSLADGTSLTNKMWSYVGVGGTNAGWFANPTVLKAWEGIIIKVNASTTLLFHITDRPYVNIHMIPLVIRTENTQSKQSWTVRIKATRTDNGVVDEENILGISNIIETPLVEPPMVGEKTVSLAFESPDGPITHDLRSPADSGWVWDYNVATPDRNPEIKLDFIDLEKAGKGYLIDKGSKMVYRLDALQQIVTRTNNGLRQYRLIVGSEEFAKAYSLGIDLKPREFVLYQNYPNPFNPYTIIRFALTTSAYVRITIYDVLGREIDRLLDTEINDGYHEVTWNPKVASGVYLYRIEIVPLIGSVKPFSVVHKMLYMK